jgi:putative transcriptional regulator
MTKRNLFDELMEGMEALQQEREGKLTLKSRAVEVKAPVQVDAATVVRIRTRFKMSRAVFAHKLRVPVRTVENWEQGRAKPNRQASALLLMAERYPDTFDRLDSL